MRLVGRERVTKNIRDPGANEWVSIWMSEVADAQWSSSSELLSYYPTAQDLGNGKFLFSVSQGKAYIEVLVSFTQKIACILHFKESN